VVRMSKDGMARLVVAVMVSGGIHRLDLAQPRAAHAAVLAATVNRRGEFLAQRFDADPLSVTPDPQVGLRIVGMTQALWRAVALGLLCPTGDSTEVVVTADAQAEAGRALCALTDEERDAVTVAGRYWATAFSTDLKHFPRARASLAGI
jgi:hypothetical protein